MPPAIIRILIHCVQHHPLHRGALAAYRIGTARHCPNSSANSNLSVCCLNPISLLIETPAICTICEMTGVLCCRFLFCVKGPGEKAGSGLFGVVLSLGVPEFVVFAAFIRNQFFVGALLDNLPAVKDRNLVTELTA